MIVKKLRFPSEQVARNAVKNLPAEAIVYIGKIIDIEGTYDEEGSEITPPTYKAGWPVDVMMKNPPPFNPNVVTPITPTHKFFEI